MDSSVDDTDGPVEDHAPHARARTTTDEMHEAETTGTAAPVSDAADDPVMETRA